MEISETGAWLFGGKKLESEHYYDNGLSNGMIALAKVLGHSEAYDFGCGMGKYVQSFNKSGIQTLGFDGNPNTNYPNCAVQDLTDSSFSLAPRSFVITLEVCEHVPKHLEEVLLKTVDNHVKEKGTLVLSWAVEGQEGTGHVNCRNNDYVIAKFESMGYNYEKLQTAMLRQTVTNAPWFRNTLLIFTKK